MNSKKQQHAAYIRKYYRNLDQEKKAQWIEKSVRRNASNTNRNKIVRRSHLLRTYGITLEKYEELLAAQKDRCAICEKLPEERHGRHKYLSVDHDHETGHVRMLLCHFCNIGIGAFKESPLREEPLSIYPSSSDLTSNYSCGNIS